MMITMITQLFLQAWSPFIMLQYLLLSFIKLIVFLSLLYGVCHRLGIIQRLLQRHIELEVSKACNGAEISTGTIQFMLQSTPNSFFTTSSLTVTDLIIHSPNSHQWKWDSPLIARIGKIHATFNLFTLIDIKFPNFIQDTLLNHIITTYDASSPSSSSPAILRHQNHRHHIMNTVVKDIYSVQAEDIQVFIEKRGNVFNFHLLDKRLDVPDAKQVLDSIGFNFDGGMSSINSTDGQDGVVVQSQSSMSTSPVSMNHCESNDHSEHNYSGGNHDNNNNDDQEAETKANEIVMSIVGAVSKIGLAAHTGGKKGLSDALQNQKNGFVSQLKKVQDLVGVKDPISSNLQNLKSSRTTKIAKESLQVIKKVGKVVEKNVLTMKEQVYDTLSKPPPMKEGYKAPGNPELFRFGFVELRDARIFTKEIIYRGSVTPNHNGTATFFAGGTRPSMDHQQKDEEVEVSQNNDNSVGNAPSTEPPKMTTNGWSKPILVKEVKIHPHEFCPSPSQSSNLSKEKNGHSAAHSHIASINTSVLLGQPIEDVSYTIITRVLTEIAKTNTGELLANAFSEVFAWFDVTDT